MNNKNLLLLHLLLMVYSVSSVFSKLAAKYPFLSTGFILCYGAVLAILFLYAIGWQQILKSLPIITAYANKAITVIWGTVWGLLFFHEQLSVKKLFGISLIVAGILLFTQEGEQADE